MKLYTVRHGETEWNIVNRICGRTDIPLTENGVEQAKETAENLKGTHIDLVLVSPMLRARQTADVICQTLGLTYETDARLLEQDYGIYEGGHRFAPEYLACKRNVFYNFETGESTAQLAHRVFGLVDELKEKYADKSVLLVCHGGVCRMVHMYFHYLDNEGFNAYRIPNAGVHFYDTQALGAQEEKNHETQL